MFFNCFFEKTVQALKIGKDVIFLIKFVLIYNDML